MTQTLSITAVNPGTGDKQLSSELLGQLTFEKFLTSYWDRQAVVFQCAIAGVVHLSPTDIYNLFADRGCHDPLYHTFTQSTNNSIGRKALVALKDQPPSARIKLIHQLSKEQMFIIRGVDKQIPSITEALVPWRRVFADKVHSNLYLSQRGVNGFPVHVDSHHVFVVQLFGKKRWRLWPLLIDAPMRGFSWDTVQPTGSSTEYSTKMGDGLYIPMGVPHIGTTDDDCSIHLTIGINLPRWLDLFRNVLYEVAADIGLLRRSIPFQFDGEQISWVVDRELEIAPLADEVLARIRKKLLEQVDQFLSESPK